MLFYAQGKAYFSANKNILQPPANYSESSKITEISPYYSQRILKDKNPRRVGY